MSPKHEKPKKPHPKAGAIILIIVAVLLVAAVVLLALFPGIATYLPSRMSAT